MRSQDGVIYEHAFGAHEKRMLLVLRIMFDKPLDILKHEKAAQIRRVEMNIIELEGDLAVPQISFVPHTQHPPPSSLTHGHLPGAFHPALLALPRIPPEEGSSPLHLTHLPATPLWQR